MNMLWTAVPVGVVVAFIVLNEQALFDALIGFVIICGVLLAITFAVA